MIKQVNLKVALFGEFSVVMTASSFKVDTAPAANSSGVILELSYHSNWPLGQAEKAKQMGERNLKVSWTITLQIPISRLKNVNQAALLYILQNHESWYKNKTRFLVNYPRYKWRFSSLKLGSWKVNYLHFSLDSFLSYGQNI